MAGINKVILLGRVGNNPEIKYTAKGIAITNFSIATSEKWRDKNFEEGKKKTEWHQIIARNKLGEICERYLFKGQQVYVEGKLKTRSWKKNGTIYYITKIVATDVHFIEK